MTKQTAPTDVRVGDVVVVFPTNPADLTIEPAHTRLHHVVEVTAATIVTSDMHERLWSWDIRSNDGFVYGYGSHPYTTSVWGIRPPSLLEKAACDAREPIGACHNAALAYEDASRELDRLRERLAEQEEVLLLAWEEHVKATKKCREDILKSAAQHGITVDERVLPPDPEETTDPARAVKALALLVGSS